MDFHRLVPVSVAAQATKWTVEAVLSGIERHLLQHYSEDERFISRRSRSQQHMRVLAFGYIKEHVVDAGARSAPRSSVAAVSKQVCGASWLAGPLIFTSAVGRI